MRIATGMRTLGLIDPLWRDWEEDHCLGLRRLFFRGPSCRRIDRLQRSPRRGAGEYLRLAKSERSCTVPIPKH